ncbi:AAA family ATPase [Acinetobacter nosocomialis]|uniref:AAA family ATPase n=1 Tax=Acinetobacter nosocomialis TaxID=106654 RepID=UPI0024DE0335|nr:AAA family ATPase [Acinetobacter nosocomialis]
MSTILSRIKLCNPDQGDNEFQNELNSVIFSYLSEEDRNECTSLDTLIKFKESALNDHLSSLKLALSNLNTEIEDLEYQAQAGVKNILESKRQLKLQELQDHESIKPIEVKSPSEELTPEQQSLKAKMDANNLRQIELLGEVKKLNEQVVDNQRKIVISKQIIDKYEILKEQVQAFKEQISESLKVLSIDNDIVTFKIDTTKIVELIDSLNEENAENSLRIDSLNKEIETCNEVVKTVRGQLTEPLQRYNEYLENLRKWDNKKLELKGDNSSLDSLFGIQYQLELIEKLPEQLTQKRNDRKDISIKIFEVLESKKLIRESLYGPVQKAIEKNKFINEKNKFEFVSKLNFSTEHFQDELTNLIMQRRLEFTPDNIKKTLDELSKHEDLDTKEGCINFIEKLIAKLEEVNDATGIADMVKKNTKPKDVYNFVYSLEFIKSKYSLRFQNAEVDKLSPGQRGALLLIFYLLVDQDKTPIILDQPEENLDNDTVVNSLVPILNEAKKTRQIIMVTHNPNLAIVCEAEQIIYTDFYREDNFSINYTSGSIESYDLNQHAVNILEGTLDAFNNRRSKYFA